MTPRTLKQAFRNFNMSSFFESLQTKIDLAKADSTEVLTVKAREFPKVNGVFYKPKAHCLDLLLSLKPLKL